MKPIIGILNLLLIVICFTNCGSDENPVPINPEELITTVTILLTPASGPAVTLKSQDLDADGPNPPNITVSGNLEVNRSYAGLVEFLNETESPADDITLEIRAEDEDHQVFYQASAGTGITVAYSDMDGNGHPVGLEFDLSTGDAGSGTFTVTLRHQPNKDAPGVSAGDITNAGGETDLAQAFSLIIQ